MERHRLCAELVVLGPGELQHNAKVHTKTKVNFHQGEWEAADGRTIDFLKTFKFSKIHVPDSEWVVNKPYKKAIICGLCL